MRDIEDANAFDVIAVFLGMVVVFSSAGAPVAFYLHGWKGGLTALATAAIAAAFIWFMFSNRKS